MYDVPVLEMYESTLTGDFDESNPYGRNCTGVRTNPAGYAQTILTQSAFQIAMKYADDCNINWTHIVRTRPDYICTSPLPWNTTQYESQGGPERYFMFDTSWQWMVGDHMYALNRAASEQLFPNYLKKYIDLPCNLSPRRLDPEGMNAVHTLSNLSTSFV